MKKLLFLLLFCTTAAYGQAQWNGFAPQQNASNPLALRVADGDLSSVLGTSTFLATTLQLTPSATNYVYLDLTQSPPKLTINTTGFPSQNIYTIAIVTTSATKITAMTDSRPPFNKLQFASAGSNYQTVDINSVPLPVRPIINFLPPFTGADNSGNGSSDISIPVCTSGSSHTAGIVADPGVSPDLTKFFRSDCTLAVPAGSSGITSPVTSPNPILFNVDLGFGGANPWADIRSYGAYTTYSTTSATISGGTGTVTLGAASNFATGEYATIYHAGAAPVVSTPTVSSVVPSGNAGGIYAVNSAAAGTTYSYCAASFGLNGDLSQCSAAVSTTTGHITWANWHNDYRPDSLGEHRYRHHNGCLGHGCWPDVLDFKRSRPDIQRIVDCGEFFRYDCHLPIGLGHNQGRFGF